MSKVPVLLFISARAEAQGAVAMSASEKLPQVWCSRAYSGWSYLCVVVVVVVVVGGGDGGGAVTALWWLSQDQCRVIPRLLGCVLLILSIAVVFLAPRSMPCRLLNQRFVLLRLLLLGLPRRRC